MKSILLSGMVVISLVSTNVLAAAKTPPATQVKTQTPHTINLNKAEAKEIQKAYKGLGLRRARAIVAYRSEHGPFKSVADVAQVKQLGKAYTKHNLTKLEKIFTVSE
jgi:competence protein ComEA